MTYGDSKINLYCIVKMIKECFPKDIPLSMMRTDDRTDLAVRTDEYPKSDSKILVRNSVGLSKDVEMRSAPLSRQRTFHFPM